MQAADAYTIHTQNIASYVLMEQACHAFCQAFTARFKHRAVTINVYCGPGNNGGDGLAISRILRAMGYINCHAFIAAFSGNVSADFTHYKALLNEGEFFDVESSDISVKRCDVIIDALFGSGISRPLGAAYAKLAEQINTSGALVVSVDIPSGLPCDGLDSTPAAAVKADWVITFQRPKLTLLLPESAPFAARFSVVDIGLDERFIQDASSSLGWFCEDDARALLKPRPEFSHKGSFGHALIVAGQSETLGAALLATRACVYAGAGLTTALIPRSGLGALNAQTPEAMAMVRGPEADDDRVEWYKYQALGIGPGLGRGARRLLERCLKEYGRPVVVDADALNILADNYEMMQLLPEFSVLTPHMKEFDRLFGEHKFWKDRIATGIERAMALGCTIVLKNRFTMVFSPDGLCSFNHSGAPSMSTGGMGDVLTGMITSFIAQGYPPQDAARLAVYIHGVAAEDVREYVFVPGRLIERLPACMFALLSGEGRTLA